MCDVVLEMGFCTHGTIVIMSEKKPYLEYSEVPAKVSETLKEYSPLMQQLLFNRGISEADTATTFLNPNYDTEPHDPFLLTDMKNGVERILSAIENDEHIVIYTDYDCDGIPGGVLLYDFFTAIGYSNFENYIPHRHEEGYGFNVDSVSKFKESDTKLIITVDCGITDNEAVAEANENKIDVIITDHHEPGKKLPDAYAVINPKRDDKYPFSGICGTTVAYKLVLGILQEGKKNEQITLKDGMEKWWLDLVGIATVADMVPLTDENRVYAHYGLQVLRKSRRPGLQHLLRKAGGNQKFLTEDDIGFTIAPRINAASRMDDPEDAFHMLRTKEEKEAGTYVAHLEKLNNERKGAVSSMVKEANKKMKQMDEIPAVIVLGNPEWRPSLVGLVANSLAEKHNRPAFIWGRDGKGIIKGSCRSDGVISVVKLMEKADEELLSFGGHHAAGGFSVSQESIHTLSETFNKIFSELHGDIENGGEELKVDKKIFLEDINDTLIRNLASLSPFGIGNHKPLFAIDVVPDDVQIFGKAKNHTKLKLTSGRNRYDAICFFKLPDEFTVEPEALKSVTILTHIERSFFMGRLETRLRIVDIL